MKIDIGKINSVNDLRKSLEELSLSAGCILMGGFLDPYWERDLKDFIKKFDEKYGNKGSRKKRIDPEIKKAFQEFYEKRGEPTGYTYGPRSMPLEKRPITLFGYKLQKARELREKVLEYELPNHIFLFYKGTLNDLENHDFLIDYDPIIITTKNYKRRIKNAAPRMPETVFVDNIKNYKNLSIKLIETFFEKQLGQACYYPKHAINILGSSSKKAAREYSLEKFNQIFRTIFPKYEFKEGYPETVNSIRRKYEDKLIKQFS